MSEFLKLQTADAALAAFVDALPTARPQIEAIPTAKALGRVLAEPITAPTPLPPFPRSTVDGYALRAKDTHGAGASQPAYLELVGEILMGTEASMRVETGQTLQIHTGGMLPPGADAVVKVEDTQSASQSTVEVLKSLAEGQNVLQAGEDVQAGDTVMRAGIPIRAQEIGGLMALGITEVSAFKLPSVAILSTGDEVVEPSAEPKPGQVRDVNSYTLSALIERAGAVPVRFGIIPDSMEQLGGAARLAHSEHDMLLITAGSSVSERDITSRVVADLGEPGVVVHGVSIRPGKPTILAVSDGVPIVGLPGNPVSALVVSGLFVLPILRRLRGLAGPDWRPTTRARLTTQVASVAGREDYLPVRLEISPEGALAEPVFGRSNLIFTLVRADGLVRIPSEVTGLEADTAVEVKLF